MDHHTNGPGALYFLVDYFWEIFKSYQWEAESPGAWHLKENYVMERQQIFYSKKYLLDHNCR